MIVNPGRRSSSDADRRFSDRIARAFSDGGFKVVWVIDEDDPLEGLDYAEVRRLLPPQQADAGLPSGQQETGPIERWARTAWKSPCSGPLVRTAALVVWACIRVLYRLEYAIGRLLWPSSRTLRVFARLYYRMRGWFGFGWRAARRSRLGHAIGWVLLKLAGPAKGRRAVRGPATVEAPSAQAELVGLVKSLGAGDAIVLPSARPAQLDMLLQLLPRLDLSSPLPTTLHVRFAQGYGVAGELGPDEGAMLRMRLKSGAPIRTIVFHGETPGQCSSLERSLGLRVHDCHGGMSGVTLRRRFAPPSGPAAAGGESLDVSPSLAVEEFGPLVLLISALWGRVGSSTAFDAQTRYLLERGFIVARVLVDHYPERGAGRAERLERLLAENFEKLRPHLHIIAERDDRPATVWRLSAANAFRQGSPVARMSMLLSASEIDDPAAAAWCAGRAVVAVVNHLPHVAFAERLTRAPIVLDTHDIFARLLTAHGIPYFVPKRPDGDRLREIDESDVWRRVAACVNVSPEDDAVVARVAKLSVLARPYVARKEPDLRSWPDVVAANRLPVEFCSTSRFDIMLWGSWHEGNIAGISWFLERVVREHPRLQQAEILLAGRVVQQLPRRLLGRQGLYAAGFVDRIDDFFARSAVLVIPDRPGITGTSVKVIDALARGCCFSSTAAGLRGIDLGDTGLVPSNDPAVLALDVAHLIGSPQARRTRAAMARRLYELNFSQDAYAQTWDAVLDTVLRPEAAAPISRAFPGCGTTFPPGGLTAGVDGPDLRPFPVPEATPVPPWP